MRKIILRTEAEKADPELSWKRPDEEFFASGACHVLSASFIATYPDAGFAPWAIRPRMSHSRGVHIVVARDDVIFDYAGYSVRGTFLPEYVEAMRAIFPGWSCDFEKLDLDPIGWDFCRSWAHRHPSQFPYDPIGRANAFVQKFPAPRIV